MSHEVILSEIAEALVEMEEEKVVSLCEQALEDKIPAKSIIEEGLIRGMDQVGELFEDDEYFLPEVLICSDIMYDGIQVVKPHLENVESEKKVKIVIGVVEGDTHDIGKNLVKIMMECGGFDIIDLGRDVPLDDFVETAIRESCDVLCMSTLMTTTMDVMRRVIEKLKERKVRQDIKVFIGGGPISQKFADEIGADVYSEDATECVRKLRELFN